MDLSLVELHMLWFSYYFFSPVLTQNEDVIILYLSVLQKVGNSVSFTSIVTLLIDYQFFQIQLKSQGLIL